MSVLQIQTALLPKTLDAPRYRISATMQPADDVGGDLYDVQIGRDGHIWLCIGDVTSHGVTPAQVEKGLQGNICRCGTYEQMRDAIYALCNQKRS